MIPHFAAELICINQPDGGYTVEVDCLFDPDDGDAEAKAIAQAKAWNDREALIAQLIEKLVFAKKAVPHLGDLIDRLEVFQKT